MPTCRSLPPPRGPRIAVTRACGEWFRERLERVRCDGEQVFPETSDRHHGNTITAIAFSPPRGARDGGRGRPDPAVAAVGAGRPAVTPTPSRARGTRRRPRVM